ncbi:hypothetical protein Vi05172_g826 [Venturia inaequalis]|nr:hypothetical protein Vi05172_g826 [Venturia inaequalis]
MLPACAATCFQEVLVNQMTCAPTDMQCICTNASLNTAIQNCMSGSCSVKDILSKPFYDIRGLH